MIFPEWTTGNIIFYSSLVIIVLAIGPLEYIGQSQMAYSKFRPASGIPTRLGMFILYFIPLIALVISALPYISNPTTAQLFVFGAVFIHFGKRVLEVLFLHKYSGPIGIITALFTAGFYSLAAFLIGFTNRKPLPNLDAWSYIGIGLFLIGITVNFIHHKILVDLRKNTLDYIIPSGGLFTLVVCPHYLFEIMGWVGIALLSRHFGAWLALAAFSFYLTARSLRTLKWYREKFSNFPPERKALIPFIL